MNPNPETLPEPKPGVSRWRRRRLWLVGLSVPLLTVLLLPTLLSTAPVRRLVLRQVNDRIPGRVELASWSLGWFSGASLTGVVLRDAAGNPVAEVKSIAIATNLCGLMGRTKHLGQITIESPRLELKLHPDGGNNWLDALRRPSVSGEDRTAPRELDPPPAAALPLAIVGKVTIRDGEVTVQAPGAALPLAIHDLATELVLDRLDQPLQLTVKGLLGAGRGPFELTTQVTGVSDGLAALVTASTLTWQQLDLAEFAPLARQLGAPVAVGGWSDGNLAVQSEGIKMIHTAGAMTINACSLAGGPLGQDRLTLPVVSLNWDVIKADQTLQVKQFALASGLATLEVVGTATLPTNGGKLAGDLAVTSRIQVAQVAAQLPGTLKLHADLRPVSGELSLAMKLNSVDDLTTVSGSLRLADLAATRGQQRIALEQPILGDWAMTFSAAGPELEGLELTCSFGKIFGRGRWEDFSLAMTGDLGVAEQELAKFIDLGKIHAKGQTELTLRVQGPATGAKQVVGSWSVKALDLAGFTPQPVTLTEATLNFQGQVELNAAKQLQALRQVKGNFVSPITTTAFLAEAVLLPEGGGLPEVVGGQLGTTADLARLSQLAVEVGLLQPQLGGGGWLRFATNFAIHEGTVELDHLDLEVTQGHWQDGDRRTAPVDLSLRGEVKFNPVQRSLQIPGLVMKFADADLAVRYLTLADWSQLPAGLTMEFMSKINLAQMQEILGGYFGLPAGLVINGSAGLSGEMIQSQEHGQQATLDAQVAYFSITQGGTPILDREQWSLQAAATLEPSAEQATLTLLKLDSPLTKLTAQGSFNDWRTRRRLEVTGQLKCDFDRLGQVLAAFSGKPMILGGQHDRPFHLATNLAAGTWRERILSTTVDFETQLTRAGYANFLATEVVLPLTVGDGIARTETRGLLGGGRFRLPATIDANAAKPRLIIPNNTMILTDIDLADAVANLLLAQFIPVLSGGATATGKLGLLARECQVPVDGDLLGETRFDGELAFAGGSLQAASFLREALAMAGLDQLTLTLPDQKLGILIAQGKVVQERLLLQVGVLSVAVYGSMELASHQLDYWIELPVTPAMFSGQKEIYELLKDEVIRVHVAGTTDHPKIASDTYRDNLAGLVTTVTRRLLKQKAGDYLRDLFKSKKKKKKQ